MNEPIPTAEESSVAAPIERRLTAAEFHLLVKVPAAAEWLANFDNPRTRRAYQGDLQGFCQFVGITAPGQFCAVPRAHVLAWRQQLEQRGLSGASLFDHRPENNAVAGGDPVQGVKRPSQDSHEGKAPALGDHQAKALLEAPDADSIKGRRDRALLAVALPRLRREEAARLTLQDIQERRGVKHLHIHGKGGKRRFLPLCPLAMERLHAYLETSGQHTQPLTPLFLAVRGRHRGQALGVNGIYALVGHYARQRSTASACGPPPPPMPWRTRWTSPRCSSGSARPTSAPPASTINARCGLRAHPPTECGTDLSAPKMRPSPFPAAETPDSAVSAAVIILEACPC